MAEPKGGRGGRRKTKPTTISKEEAQRLYVEAISQGLSVAEAASRAQRTEKAVEYWRKTDPAFREKADHARALATARQGDRKPTDIGFAEFCETYLNMRIWPHQQQWVDLLEGREPTGLHPSQIYKPGDKTRIVVNTPPFHGKSMTLSIAYPVYRICTDPNVRILLVSQSEDMAKKFLYAIKNRLTAPSYQLLQTTFGPQNGYEKTAEAWAKDYITLGVEQRDSGEKDPTVQALGMKGHIYGSRADLVILDDCVTGKNAHMWEEHVEWLHTEVDSRIEEDTGRCLVVGTRIKPEDLYVKLRDPEDFTDAEDDVVHDGESEVRPWTYLSQPAVLEFADNPKDWKTLWPRCERPWSSAQEPHGDGTYDRWDGPRLAKKRRRSARIWSLVYMQQDVAEDATFPAIAVHRSVEGRRNVGPMVPGLPGHRRRGMDGLYVIGAVDPAAAGHTAMVVYAVDRETRMRYVLQAVNVQRMKPSEMRGKILDLTDQFGISEWVIEKNAFQGYLSRDEEITVPLQSRGVRIREHHTGTNKIDPDLGVASMSVLFGTYDGQNCLVEPLISLASTQNSHAMKSLVEQLVTWQPAAPKAQKTDLVMALWMAETRAKELVSIRSGARQTHMPSRFTSPRRAARSGVVNLLDFAQQRGA